MMLSNALKYIYKMLNKDCPRFSLDSAAAQARAATQ